VIANLDLVCDSIQNSEGVHESRGEQNSFKKHHIKLTEKLILAFILAKFTSLKPN
jgi:hypothetical protein